MEIERTHSLNELNEVVDHYSVTVRYEFSSELIEDTVERYNASWANNNRALTELFEHGFKDAMFEQGSNVSIQTIIAETHFDANTFSSRFRIAARLNFDTPMDYATAKLSGILNEIEALDYGYYLVVNMLSKNYENVIS